MKKKLISLLLCLVLLLLQIPTTALITYAEEADPLIGEDEEVLELIDYTPTRVDAATLLYRLHGQPPVEDLSILDPYTDLSEEDYSDEQLSAIAWTLSNNITYGIASNLFGPEETITKAQFVVFLWKSFGSPAPTQTICPYTDIAVGKFYYDAVMWTLDNLDWLDCEPTDTSFDPMKALNYMRLFHCRKADDTLSWKLRISTNPLVITSGSCGDDLYWSYDTDSKTLSFTGSGDMTSTPWRDAEFEIEQLVFPDAMTGICDNAFEGCTGLTSVDFPAGLTNIGSWAFYDCTGLSSLDLPEGLTGIGYCTFYKCSGLSSVSFPEGLTRIGSHAFEDCTGLTSVVLPDGITVIEEGLFWGCTGLTSVVLPASLTQIELYAFSDCTGLTSVVFPAGLTQIGEEAFSGCVGLTSVVFPAGLTQIGEEAFSGCTSLSAVTLPKSLQNLSGNAFDNCDALRQLVFRNPAALAGLSFKYEVKDSWEEEDSSEDLSDENWIPFISSEYLHTLGLPEQTVVYGPHDEDLSTDLIQKEIANSYERFTWCDAYMETYAKRFGYTYYPTNAFSDVKAGDYFEIPVAWAVGNGITRGSGSGIFSPKKTCTREQIVTFLWKAKGAPEPVSTENPFTDVKEGKYYYKAVLWAVENKITGGTSADKFGVGKACTREQAMSFLWKACGSPDPTTTENPFTDVKEGKYYYKAVLWAVENGITGGASADKFGVGKNCTRAQIVTFLFKAFS